MARRFLAGLIVVACVLRFAGPVTRVAGQTVTIDTSPSGRGQTIDGFGTCLSGTEAQQAWWQNLFFDDLQCSIVRMDLTPPFKAPWNGTNGYYNAPWFGVNPSLPGPESNNVRTYIDPTNYTRSYNGWSCPIPVMGTNINVNIAYFDFSNSGPNVAATVATAGFARAGQLSGFKLIGSLWSPMPWVKMLSGNTISGQSDPLPRNGTPFPFIWGGNFSGGVLDVSGTPLEIFDDGTGPTSSLTQFARAVAAYLRGFQQTYGVQYYAISIQNELNFEEYYNSCLYPLSPAYIAALKAVRAELDKYPDLAPIKLMGPEDLLGGDPYGLWQYGSGSTTTHKNLQFLQNIQADPVAAAAEAFFCIHGYASDGVSAPNAVPTQWNWWASGWTTSPAAGIPANVSGFTAFGKKSWMTETSGEDPAWISPTNGFPGQGAWSLALRIHNALTAGQESAWVYWQLTDGNPVGAQELTDSTNTINSPKYVAAKHFFRYIRPNSVLVNAAVAGTTNLNASAYLNETNGTMTVVLINAGSNSLTATVNTPASPSGIASWQAFTSSDGSYWQPSVVPATGGTAAVAVPGYGVVTLYGVGRPVLRASLSVSSQLTLSWTAAAAGFALQSSTSLSPIPNWTVLTNVPATNNGQLAVTLAPAAGGQPTFYRLANP